MDDVAVDSVEPRYPDRSAGLILFGILHLLIALCCAAFALFVSMRAEMPQAGGTITRSQLASSVVFYGLATIYFAAIGVGSIRARRWARALAVVVSALWLIGGFAATLITMILLPKMTGGVEVPAAATGCAVGALALMGIALPLLIFLFYRSPNVRRTCEARDPFPGWTDRVPLPVLAVVIVMAFGSISLLANISNPVLPVMGSFMTGAPAALTMFAFAALSAFMALQLYRLKESAWWALILLQVFGVIFGTLTLVRTDFAEYARRSGMNDTSAQMANFWHDPLFIGGIIATWIVYFAFLLYLRRFFAVRVAPRTRRDD